MTLNGRSIIWRLGLLVLVLGLLCGGTDLFGQARPDYDDPGVLDKPGVVTAPANGSGVMVTGEFWDSFMPANKGPYYGEASQPIIRVFVRMGNFDRAWSTPTHMWPGGWTNGNYWAKGMLMAEYNPDPTFNPATVGGAANPSHNATDGPNYAMAAYKSTMAGAGDPARDYSIETRFVDGQTRHHAVYEAGWPTNLGIDVKMKIHQWELNWNNFNDFVIVELQLTNTGNVDINCDGTVERTGNVINALTLVAHGEFMCSYTLGRTGGRGNRFGSTRAIGYIGDADPTGAPWDMMIGYPGESVSGTRDMGLNDFPQRFYTDIWSSWTWLGVKQGAMDPAGTDKQTIFGTHPIGVGPERGWYISAGQGRGLGLGFSNPKNVHSLSMGTFYVDGGKSRDAAKFDLAPNANFFDSGTPGNPTTFVPKAAPTRPNGDRKLFSEEDAVGAFEVATYESGWTKGFTGPNNFDGDMFSGVGPFNLAVGETITIYWAEGGGFRLQGVANAMAAARYVFANNLDLGFTYPAVPEMRLDNTLNKTVRISWDNRAESGAGFAGYKIWKANLAKKVEWLETGTRVMDEYWRNTTPGPTPDALKKPVNPNFAAQAFVAGKVGVPDTWGPWELIKVIPAAELGQYTAGAPQGYNYAFEEETVELGFKYWYYVSAYTSGTYDLGPTWVAFPGTNPATTNTIETSHMNVNGAEGLWQDIYPWTDLNSFYTSKDADGLKKLGAGFTVQSALASASDLVSGAATIGVKPNPYKKKALFDSAVDAFDHKVIFYNLPPQAKITILDVSGQIINEINFESNEPNNGSTFWNMFSKDGIEVASGLYIYVVDYEGGQQVGYLSILR